VKPGTGLSAAQQYAERGWAVFPVEPRGKRPLGRLVPHGLLDATTDDAVVEGWWRAEPDANIGLVTGIHFDVLDIDTDEGHSSFVVAMPDGAPLLDGPTALTGGDGYHRYLEPTGLGNKAGFLPHCDWRGRGGYVVAPPSLHASGRSYEWWPGEEDPWFGKDAPLQQVPPWLLKLLEPPRPPVVALATPKRVTGDACRYGRAALEAEVANVLAAPVGRRNHTLNQAGFNMGTLMVVRAVDPEETAAALLAAALRAGLPEREARATLASGIRAGLDHPRRLA
jgi:Bifunctional DNA primase/polymerase, N-terminal